MIEFLNLRNRCVVFRGDLAQVIALAHLVVLSRSGRLLGLLRLLRLCRRLVRVRYGDRVTGDIQRIVLDFEVVEVDKAVGIDVVTEIADLKMEVSAVGAAGIATETDNVAGLHHLSRIDETAGKVSVVGFQTVVVADDHEVSVSAGIGRALGDAHDAVPRGRHGSALRIAEIDASVHPFVTVAVVRGDAVVGGMMITGQIDSVTRRGTLMTIMDGHNVEILIQVETRHPVEIGEQQTVAMIDIVEVGVVHRIDEIAQRVLFDFSFNARGVVHHAELDMVLLRRQTAEREQT